MAAKINCILVQVKDYCNNLNFKRKFKRAKKYDEGKAVLKRFMIQTNTPLTKLDELSDKLVKVSESQKSSPDSKISMLQLFTPDFRKTTLVCFFMMFTACLGSVGMFLDSSGEPCDLLWNNIWVSRSVNQK